VQDGGPIFAWSNGMLEDRGAGLPGQQRRGEWYSSGGIVAFRTESFLKNRLQKMLEK
jgi:hypothetical protein